MSNATRLSKARQSKIIICVTDLELVGVEEVYVYRDAAHQKYSLAAGHTDIL